MKRSTHYVAILAGLCVLLAGFSVSAFTKKQLGITINLAGKQRMLTQRMSKEVFFIAKGIHVAHNKKALANTSALFARTLQGLLQGDKGLGLVRTKQHHIRRQLNRVRRLWVPFFRNIKLVQRGKTYRWLWRRIAQQNVLLLKQMDKAVGMYAKLSKKGSTSLSPQMAIKINLAGKQRMLSQKITKELLLVALNISKKKNLRNLTKSTDLFALTLQGLFRGERELKLTRTSDPAIRRQLEKVRSLWSKYEEKVIWKAQKGKISMKTLLLAEKLNLPLLREMNKAVVMYERSATKERTVDPDLF